MRNLVKNLLVLILLAIRVHAQQKLNLESLIPPAPNSAELGKYGAFPVGHLTGIPNIQFPIYEVRSGKLQLPIILSYHAAGIQVNQKSTDVGLGWSIMAGGTITRTVYGAPDDGIYGYFNYDPPSPETLYSINNFYTMQLYSNPGYDMEPDLFLYNIGGKSGKFIYTKADTFMTIPFEPIRIQRNVTDKTIFKVIDDNGNIYTFDQTSNTIVDWPAQRSSINSWYLSSIVSADYTDTIRFEYVTSVMQDPVRQEILPVGMGLAGLVVGPAELVNGTSLYNELLLNKIYFRNGYVQFNRTTLRKDVNNIPGSCYALDEIVVNNLSNQLIKKVRFPHDYFISSPFMDRWDFYRLRLKGFTETGADTTIKREYKFNYDSTIIPQYHSFNMDYWGFCNGSANNSFIPNTTVRASEINSVTFGNGMSYSNGFLNPTESWSFGGSNREPSASYMCAGILNKIVYPTGGYSVFEYEPHQYMSEEYVQQLISKSNVTHGINKFTLATGTQTFNYPENASNAAVNPPDIQTKLTIVFSASNMGNTEMGETQRVIFKDITTNSIQTWTHTGDLTVPLTLEPIVTLINGHSYSIKHEIYGQYEVTISTYLNWNENQQQQVQKIGGGLRIKSIKSYPDSSVIATNEQTFKYGTNENGLGVKIFNERNFYRNYEDVVFDYFKKNGEYYCRRDKTFWQRRYLGVSKYNPLTYMGSPILYSSVTSYNGTPLDNEGKTVYTYNIVSDPDNAPDEFINSGNYGAINKAWNQGELLEEATYKNASGQFIPVSKARYEYEKYNPGYENAIQIKQYKQFIKMDDCSTDPTGPDPTETRPGQGYFSFYNYTIKTGAVRRTKETKVIFSSSSPLDSVVTTTNYKYQNPWHLYLTELSVSNSKGEGKISRMKYPQDVAGAVPAAMVTKNILAPVLEQREYKSVGASETLLTATLTGYKQSGNQINKDTIKISTGSNVPEPRIEYKLYNAQSNILEQKMTNNVVQSYIWDYKGEYPVAEVTNALSSQIAYTSFESDGTGNWTVGGSPRNAGGITGKQYYSLSNGAVYKSGLTTGKVYIVSYWTTSSTALNIAGTQGPSFKGRTFSGWTYFEHRVTGVQQITIPQIAVSIDELRLYPEDAQMMTFTYDPGIGITSMIDSRDMISYYLYDALNRLIVVKDLNGNILKTIDYKFLNAITQ